MVVNQVLIYYQTDNCSIKIVTSQHQMTFWQLSMLQSHSMPLGQYQY